MTPARRASENGKPLRGPAREAPPAPKPKPTSTPKPRTAPPPTPLNGYIAPLEP